MTWTRHLLHLALAALPCWAAAAPPASVEDTLSQRVVPCTACHGKEGRAAPDGYHPRIAGKPAGYLYNQLLNFRDGRRRYGPMVYLVDPLSDDYLREIAGHFAALELPACTQCHGQALTGVAPAIPGLLGLPRDYLSAQLGAWVTGQRRAHAPDCMAQVAQRLAPGDASAVAAWLASQPLPASSKPASSLPAALPLPCGGVPK